MTNKLKVILILITINSIDKNMNNPTIAEVAAAYVYLLESGAVEEKELLEFRKAIQDARMKTASTPWAFIMSVNMDGKVSKRGATDDRRMLLRLIMRNFFSSLIFCQELPGCFKEEVVDTCGTGGYKFVKNENQASVLWLAEEFYGEPLKTTDSSIDKIVKELTEQRSDVDVSELRGRMALVKLTKIGEEASGCQPFLAASWHGPCKEKLESRKKKFKGLTCFLREVCKKEKVSSFIIGGDFNIDTLDDIDLEKNMIVPRYDLTSRAESKSKEGTNYIPYKDNFIVLNERYRDIWVSSVRSIEFENSTDFGSDITKEDHQKFNKRKKLQDTERKDLLDHDPIVGVLALIPGKRTGSYQRSDVEAAKTQSIAEDKEYEQDEVRLRSRLHNFGLQIRDNIPKDGNCLFHAVSDQLNRLGGFRHYSHTSLRHLAVKTLRRGSHGLFKDHISKFVPNNDLASYLTNMERDGAWGGHIELTSLARTLGRTIRVVSSQGPSHDFKEEAGNPDSAPILLGLLSDERHYVSLEPRNVSESPLSDDPAVDHNLTDLDSDSPDKNDKDNDPISKDFAGLSLEESEHVGSLDA